MGRLGQDDKEPRQAMFTAREPTFSDGNLRTYRSFAFAGKYMRFYSRLSVCELYSLYKQYKCRLECAGLNLERDRHYRVLIGNATGGVED
jgi:hypothetical protein